MTSIKLKARVYYMGEDRRGANRLKARLLLSESTGVRNPQVVFDLPMRMLAPLAHAGAFARGIEIEVRLAEERLSDLPATQPDLDLKPKGGGEP